MSEKPSTATSVDGPSTYWIEEDGSGVCPHCGVPVQYANQASVHHPPPSVHRPPFAKKGLQQDMQRVEMATCTNCGMHVADWVFFAPLFERRGLGIVTNEKVLRRVGAYPRSRMTSVASEVPETLARDYQEAVAVAPISTRAAAALARRGLQAALRACGFQPKSKTLNTEIELALADSRTPTPLAEKLRFVQNVGNDAVHPNVDADGDLIEVTPEDLTVIIAALDEFYDVFFVKPKRHAAIMKVREERKKGEGA